MYIVAHPDDTLLFQSPSILNQIRDGSKVLTVHVAAGDGGLDARYWTRREAGIRAAYAQMAQTVNEWTSYGLSVEGHEILLTTLDAKPNILVAFMRLPDGGFPGPSDNAPQNSEGLSKLWHKSKLTMVSVDGLNSYTNDDLIATLATVMNRFRPRLIAVQDFVSVFTGGDHTDHYATARFSRAAHEICSFPHELVGYEGYPVQYRAVNVSGPDLELKREVFYTYGRFDSRACYSAASCAHTPYATWLQREYVVGREITEVETDERSD